MARLRIVDKDHGYKVLMRNASSGRLGRQLSVGVVTDDMEVLEAALAAEYGLGYQPERSYLRAWFDRNRRRLESDMRALGLSALRGEEKISALRSLGERYAEEVRQFIMRGIRPALRPATVREKEREGAARPTLPLVRHGRLLQAIRALIDGEALR